MPYTANTNYVQILNDTSSHVVAKLHLFQHTAGVEADVLKINVDSLVGRTQTLTIDDGTATATFHPGEVLTDIANATCIVYVSDWKYPTLSVVLANSASPVDNSATLLGARGSSVDVKGDGASMDPARLSLRNISWSIVGNASSRVALQWDGSPNVEIFAMGQGQGWGGIGKSHMGTTIPNNANSATGSISLSSWNMPDRSGYNIILECSKVAGFETRPIG